MDEIKFSDFIADMHIPESSLNVALGKHAVFMLCHDQRKSQSVNRFFELPLR